MNKIKEKMSKALDMIYTNGTILQNRTEQNRTEHTFMHILRREGMLGLTFSLSKSPKIGGLMLD